MEKIITYIVDVIMGLELQQNCCIFIKIIQMLVMSTSDLKKEEFL